MFIFKKRQKTYPFSDELSRAPDSLQKTGYKEAIGKTLICDDGIPRKVLQCVTSMAFPWKCLVNEYDPESKGGHYLSILSLTTQLLGKPPPSKEALDAFERIVKIRFGIVDEEKPHRLIH